MAEPRLERTGSPQGLTRLAFRAPIWLYRAHLGFVMGRRFVMLEHTGRKSGKTRQTVLEVVADRPDAVYVAAAWGTKADWLRNIMSNSHVVVHHGGRTFATESAIVDESEAGDVLSEYGARHPKAFDRLAKFMLDDPGETTAIQVARVAASIPVVRLARPER